MRDILTQRAYTSSMANILTRRTDCARTTVFTSGSESYHLSQRRHSLLLQADDKEMEKYCFGGHTESVLTSCHISLPAAGQLPDNSKVSLQTSETPLPLTASSLQSFLNSQTSYLRLQPYVLNKTHNSSEEEKSCSDCPVMRNVYPYQLKSSQKSREEKSDCSDCTVSNNVYPYQLKTLEKSKEHSSTPRQNQGLWVEKLKDIQLRNLKESKTDKPCSDCKKLDNAYPFELKTLEKSIKEKCDILNKISPYRLKSLEEKSDIEKICSHCDKLDNVFPYPIKPLQEAEADSLPQKQKTERNCREKGGLRVEKLSQQNRPKEIKKQTREEPVEMCAGGGPVMIRTNEKPVKVDGVEDKPPTLKKKQKKKK